MIVFDLRCRSSHVFEAWFGSTEDYESQAARGLVTCPSCGDASVEKAVMAPAVGSKGNRQAVAPPRGLVEAMTALKAKVEQNCDYVGDRFVAEARAIHYGEVEARGIYGEATPADAASLRDEGVEIAALPFPTRRCADA